MILLISLILAHRYQIKICNSKDDYIKVPEISPFAANQNLVNMITEFQINASFKYKKGFRILNLPKFKLCTSESTQDLFYAEKEDLNCNNFNIIPVDYNKCFKITFQGKCLIKNENDGQFVADVCQKRNPRQEFEFVCINCLRNANNENESLGGIKSFFKEEPAEPNIDLQMLKSVKIFGKLDFKAYTKIINVHRITKNISKCMTINDTCNEHASESIPPICFVGFSLAHYMKDQWLKDWKDQQHHKEDETETEKFKKQLEKDDNARFELKYGDPTPNLLTKPVTTQNELEKIILKEKNARLIDEMNSLKKSVLGAEDRIPKPDFLKPFLDEKEKRGKENDNFPIDKEIEDLKRDTKDLPGIKSGISLIIKTLNDIVKNENGISQTNKFDSSRKDNEKPKEDEIKDPEPKPFTMPSPEPIRAPETETTASERNLGAVDKDNKEKTGKETTANEGNSGGVDEKNKKKEQEKPVKKGFFERMMDKAKDFQSNAMEKFKEQKEKMEENLKKFDEKGNKFSDKIANKFASLFG